MGDTTAHGGRDKIASGRQRATRRQTSLRHLNQTSRRHNGSNSHNRASTPTTFAALDLGTNNCRLLIAESVGQSFRVIDSFSRIVRLSEGLAVRGVLSESAMARTISALRVCAGKMHYRRVKHARCIATDACRRAANCDEFITRVTRETGIELQIISPFEEAQLVIAGSRSLLDPKIPYALLFDIGGGSTEIVWIRLDIFPYEMVGWTSLPCGVVNLSEAHGGDIIPRSVYDSMVSEVWEYLAPFEDTHHIAERIAAGEVQMLGASGTVTTMAGVHLELARYDRARVDGLRFAFDDIDRVSARLQKLDLTGRAAIPTIGPERADLVISGCAILEAIKRLWPVGFLRVADRGIREGLLMGMIHPSSHATAGHITNPGHELPDALSQ